MTSKVEIHRTKVFIVSLILLLTISLISLLIFKTSINMILIITAGWITTLLNFYLLRVFVFLALEVQKPLSSFLLQIFRLGIYALSAWYCIKNEITAICWTAGLLTVIVAVIVVHIKPNEERREVI